MCQKLQNICKGLNSESYNSLSGESHDILRICYFIVVTGKPHGAIVRKGIRNGYH